MSQPIKVNVIYKTKCAERKKRILSGKDFRIEKTTGCVCDEDPTHHLNIYDI